MCVCLDIGAPYVCLGRSGGIASSETGVTGGGELVGVGNGTQVLRHSSQYSYAGFVTGWILYKS